MWRLGVAIREEELPLPSAAGSNDLLYSVRSCSRLCSACRRLVGQKEARLGPAVCALLAWRRGTHSLLSSRRAKWCGVRELTAAGTACRQLLSSAAQYRSSSKPAELLGPLLLRGRPESGCAGGKRASQRKSSPAKEMHVQTTTHDRRRRLAARSVGVASLAARPLQGSARAQQSVGRRDVHGLKMYTSTCPRYSTYIHPTAAARFARGRESCGTPRARRPACGSWRHAHGG